MKTSEFDYHLPSRCIAQTPVEPRNSSRLLVLTGVQNSLEHKVFSQLGAYLQPGDVLVLNQTRVIPARIKAVKSTGGKVEILLLHKVDSQTWEALVGGKNVHVGS